jgi:hypothetical protein
MSKSAGSAERAKKIKNADERAPQLAAPTTRSMRRLATSFHGSNGTQLVEPPPTQKDVAPNLKITEAPPPATIVQIRPLRFRIVSFSEAPVFASRSAMYCS